MSCVFVWLAEKPAVCRQARNIRNTPVVNRDRQSVLYEEMQNEIKVSAFESSTAFLLPLSDCLFDSTIYHLTGYSSVSFLQLICYKGTPHFKIVDFVLYRFMCILGRFCRTRVSCVKTRSHMHCSGSINIWQCCLHRHAYFFLDKPLSL